MRAFLVSLLLVVAVAGPSAASDESEVFNCKELVVKPTKLNLTCDGPPVFKIDGEEYPGSGGMLTNVKWKTWGPTKATGTGRLALSSKADGVYKRMRVQVTLGKVKTQKGERVFTEAVTTQGPGYEINTWPIKKWHE